jgi:cysteine-rich repeat protein
LNSDDPIHLGRCL